MVRGRVDINNTQFYMPRRQKSAPASPLSRRSVSAALQSRDDLSVRLERAQYITVLFHYLYSDYEVVSYVDSCLDAPKLFL